MAISHPVDLFVMSFLINFILFRLPNEGKKYPLWEIWLLVAGIKAFTHSLVLGENLSFAVKFMFFYWKGLIIRDSHAPHNLCGQGGLNEKERH